MKKEDEGITLVTLVVTIIVLLILASISISQLTESGLLKKVKMAQQMQQNAQIEEENILGQYENVINEEIKSNKKLYAEEFDIIYSKQSIGCIYNHTISDEELKYRNIMVIISAMNTAIEQAPAFITVTNDNIKVISNNDILAYSEYGIYTTKKLYVGMIENIVKEDVIKIQAQYACEVLVLGIKY